MNARVNDLMSTSVVTAQPHQSVDHVRKMLEKNGIGAVPVVDADDQPIGIVSATDLAADLNPASPIRTVMTDRVLTVPQYEDASIAARVMRNHHIHRVVVTHEQRVVGILSAFDLLKLVEGHRWVPKQPPTQKKRRSGKRVGGGAVREG